MAPPGRKMEATGNNWSVCGLHSYGGLRRQEGKPHTRLDMGEWQRRNMTEKVHPGKPHLWHGTRSRKQPVRV